MIWRASVWLAVSDLPPTYTSPEEGATSPVMHLKRVDLPAPFVPRITKHEFSLQESDIPLTASNGLENRFV